MSSQSKTPEEYKGPTDFVPLHCHTIFSPLDGCASPQQYADECAKRGWKAMAATEHGNMASVPDMYFAFKKHGLKSIAGIELYYNDYELFRQKFMEKGGKIAILRERDPALAQRIGRNRHVTVLAKNAIGLHNLIKLSTLAYTWGYYYYPRSWFAKLEEYREGLIILSGCLNGPISHEIRLDCEHRHQHGTDYPRNPKRDKTATQYIEQFKEAFGDDFFLEVQMPCIPELFDHEAFWAILAYGHKYGVNCVLSNDSHYVSAADAYTQKIMMAIDQKVAVDDPGLFYTNSEQQYLKTRAELWATFHNYGYSAHVKDAVFDRICDNTLLVADRCEKLHPDTAPKIPSWSTIEPGVDPDERLRELAYNGLRARGLDKDEMRWPIDGKMVTYIEQTEIELERFINKGFASYFLITHDLITWGKQQGWPFGPRGSSGGSLVCFLLNVHCLDPLLWGLSFDRFMASSRGGYQLRVQME